jgi:hypothetical protein
MGLFDVRESWLAGWLVGSLAPEAISKMFNLRHTGISEASIQTEVLVLYIFFMRRESRILLCGIYYLLTYSCLLSLCLGHVIFNYSTIHLFIYSSIHLFIYSPIHLFTYSPIQLFNYSTIQLSNYSTIQLFIYSSIHLVCVL